MIKCIYYLWRVIHSRTYDTFAIRFPQKQKPSANSVKIILEKFKNFGTLRARGPENTKSNISENLYDALQSL